MALIFGRGFALALVLLMSLGSYADETCEGVLSGSEEQVYRTFFKNYSENYQDGLSMRGFMGSAVPNKPYTVELAMEYGLIWWGMKWNFVASVEEAIEHRLKGRALHEKKGTPFTDIIVAGQYFIGSESELGLSFEEGKSDVPVPPEKVRELIARGAYEVDHLGNATFIPPERLARRISETTMGYHKVGHLPGAFGKNSISQSGWVAFKMHGIHDYSTWKNSDGAKKLRKLARQLAERGYTIRFNTDFEAMLDKIKNQKRSYRDQQENEDGEMVAGERKEHEANTSRYTNETVYNTALGLLKAGKGYSVGVYNEKGELVGGEIGFRSGNHLYGDSVFYDDVNYAKIAALALFEVLDAAGMPYSDPGMITPYTASMGAELVPFPEYMQKIKSGPAGPIALPALWDPRPEGHLDAAFTEIVKRKNQGLGNLRITRRLPLNNDESRLVADRHGLERGTLNVVVVSSPEQAAAYVQGKAWADMPVFLQVSEEVLQSRGEKGPAEFLREVLGGEVSAYFIGSSRHPEVRKPVAVKQLLEVLDLDLAVDPPVWIDGAAVAVPGWGFKSTAKGG